MDYRTRSISVSLFRQMIFAFSAIVPITSASLLQPLEASSNSSDELVTANSCGVRVYMTASGPGTEDTTNDAAVKASLESGTNLCVTVGNPYYTLSTVAGTVTTSNYDVVYLQGQNNYISSYLNQFDASDLQVIDNFLIAGGGMVIGEWQAWNACAMAFAGAWGGLDALMPTQIRNDCAYGSNQKVRFYRWERPLSTLIDTGVNSDFVFQPADYNGSLSFLTLKTGATGFYYATWDPVVSNIPAAISPGQLPIGGATGVGGVGMAGWVPAGKTGRVFTFATTNGAAELSDTSASNSFRRLLVNALGWSGSVGGSLNPDIVAVTAQAGSNVLTPVLVPSRMTGTVAYSIISGTLPTGLSLSTSTGQISGSTNQNATVTVTIQGVGSISGQATSVISFTFTGGVTPTSSTSTLTTTTTTTTTTVPRTTTTTAAPTTTVASVTTTSEVAPTTTVSLRQTQIARVVTSTTTAERATNTTLAAATTTTVPRPVATTAATTTTTTVPEIAEAAPGEASILVGGEPVESTLSRSNDQLVVSAGDLSATISAITADGAVAPLDSEGNIRLSEGDQIQVEASGFAPNSDVEVWLFSTPTLLGTVTVNSEGTASAVFPLPRGAESGNHRVALNGKNVAGDDASFAVGIVIGSNSGGVSTTGKVLIAIPIALAVLFALVIPARRRRGGTLARP